MDSDSARFNKVKALYTAAARLPLDERQEFLGAVCANDPELLRDVEQLLDEETAALEEMQDDVARVALDLGPSYPGVSVEPVKWRRLSTAERALIATAALP